MGSTATTTVASAKEVESTVMNTQGHLRSGHGGAHRIGDLRPFIKAPINLYPTADDETGYIRSLPELIEFNAKENPNHLFCIQARKQADSSTFSGLPLTNSQLKDAVLRCVSWLKENVEELRLPSVNEDGIIVKGPPIALFMESDVGLLLHQYALMSLGVPILLLSARLSPTAIQHLLSKTSAVAIMVSPRLRTTAQDAKDVANSGQNSTVNLYTVATFDTFIRSDSPHFGHSVCASNHYIDQYDRDVLILHSSGTTGLPKPIYVSHKHLVSFVTCHDFVTETEAQGINVSSLPLYHGFGFVTPALAMGVGKTFCLPASSVVPNASAMVGLLKAVHAASLMSVPSILEDISLMPDDQGAEVLAGLDFVTFGGGVLKSAVGERLAAKGVRILNHYGATESGPLSLIFVPRSDYNWRYFRLRRDTKMKIEEVAPYAGERRFKLITYPFGWRTPFEIQDQLVCNPSNPDTEFNAVGRNDDLIVLATGEKVNPQILETLLSESSLVKTAIAFGDNQFEIGVFVEPVETVLLENELDYKTSIWPLIAKAGSMMDDFAKVTSREAIFILPAGTTIPRTDKGSIARREMYKSFEAEIAQVYLNLENSEMDVTATPLNMEALEQGIKELIQTRLAWKIDPSQWGFDDDLFELGMDSLQAARLRRHLISSIPKFDGISVTEGISRGFVYLNPSVAQMAHALRMAKCLDESPLNLEAEVDQLVNQYALPSTLASLQTTDKIVILLTGGTGSLGAHCLAKFANLRNVDRVICLNRPSREHIPGSDGRTRLQNSLKAKGIDLCVDGWKKVHVLQTNTASPSLGLTDLDYTEVLGSVTHILHTAWPMDFKLQLSSFNSQFQTLRNLISLASEIHENRPMVKPRILFVSSIATIGKYSAVHGGRIVPEVLVNSVDCVNDIGYAQAKLVCERMLERAANNCSGEIETSSVRFGQLSGSRGHGFWNTNEHFAALVKSSQKIQALPCLSGTFAWIPVDDAADVISELLLAKNAPALVYHVENPVRQSWDDALSTIALDLKIAKSLPFETWLDDVCASIDSSNEGNPAKKLEDFFRHDFQRMACGQVIMGTDKSRKASVTLRNMDVLPAEVISSYVSYWRSVGFLS